MKQYTIDDLINFGLCKNYTRESIQEKFWGDRTFTTAEIVAKSPTLPLFDKLYLLIHMIPSHQIKIFNGSCIIQVLDNIEVYGAGDIDWMNDYTYKNTIEQLDKLEGIPIVRLKELLQVMKNNEEGLGKFTYDMIHYHLAYVDIRERKTELQWFIDTAFVYCE